MVRGRVTSVPRLGTSLVLLGGERSFAGSLGTQSVKIFDLVATRTGLLHEATAARFDPMTFESETWITRPITRRATPAHPRHRRSSDRTSARRSNFGALALGDIKADRCVRYRNLPWNERGGISRSRSQACASALTSFGSGADYRPNRVRRSYGLYTKAPGADGLDARSSRTSKGRSGRCQPLLYCAFEAPQHAVADGLAGAQHDSDSSALTSGRGAKPLP
jgi:hypothetical protein